MAWANYHFNTHLNRVNNMNSLVLHQIINIEVDRQTLTNEYSGDFAVFDLKITDSSARTFTVTLFSHDNTHLPIRGNIVPVKGNIGITKE